MIAGTTEFLFFCLVMMRMSGFVLFNPVFGRNNIPALFRTGLAMVLTVLVYSTGIPDGVVLDKINTPIVFGMALLKEYVCGYIIGYIMVLFDYVVTYAGAVIDFQMGLSMASVYDPQNGSQTALTGKILQIYFLMLFFAVDGHMALIKILLTSSSVVPYGNAMIGLETANAIVTLFTECTVLALKLSFPVIALEFLTEIAVGLLMKIIPQINLFVLNIEMKVVIGIAILMILISPIGSYLNILITRMISEIQDVLMILAS